MCITRERQQQVLVVGYDGTGKHSGRIESNLDGMYYYICTTVDESDIHYSLSGLLLLDAFSDTFPLFSVLHVALQFIHSFNSSLSAIRSCRPTITQSHIPSPITPFPAQP